MASIEFIQKRIAGKEAEIAKLEKKLERILKAQSTNWETNPYYYSEYDLRWTQKDLESAKTALEGYRADLATATEKANSRNVQVIIDFLEQWKLSTRNFYIDAFARYLVAKEAHREQDKKLYDLEYSLPWKSEERKAVEKERREASRAFSETWGFLNRYETRKLNAQRTAYEWALDLEKLDKDLKEEAERKYDFIIERTNAIVGKITDASNLFIGAKHDLNGFIIGERGTAKVQTIGAGGYNIQCFHFRTLIHSM